MSKIIEYATKRIMNEIPIQLLTKAFNPHPQYGQGLFTSREEIIADEVIRQRVIPDAHIVGGEQRSVPLSSAKVVQVDNTILYKIPLKATGGRKITSVLSLETVTSDMTNLAPNMLSAAIGPTSTGTANVELVGPNVIATPVNLPYPYMFVRCVIANDPQLSNFSQRSYLAFGRMAVMAAKATVYNKLIIAVGESGTNGGNTNQAVQSMIDSYADATELYNEFLETKWRKISKFADAESNRRRNESVSY